MFLYVAFLRQHFAVKTFGFALLLVIMAAGCSDSSDGKDPQLPEPEPEPPAPIVTMVMVNPPQATVAIDTEGAFQATALFSNNTHLDVTTVARWSSSDESIVEVGRDTGHARAQKVGEATISATYKEVSGSSDITVSPATLLSIDVKPKNVAIPAGLKIPYSATGVFSDESVQDITEFADWGSRDTFVAEIDDMGLASTLNVGTTTIRAAYEGRIGETVLAVTSSRAINMTIEPTVLKAPVKSRVDLEVTAYYTDGTEQNVTLTVQWSSSDEAVARVSSNGAIQTLAAGEVEILASYENLAISIQLTVTEATLESIRITPGGNTINLGGTVQYKAVGRYSDGSYQNITALSTWTSSNTKVASIQTDKLAGYCETWAAGDTDIQAYYAGISATYPSTLQVLGN